MDADLALDLAPSADAISIVSFDSSDVLDDPRDRKVHNWISQQYRFALTEASPCVPRFPSSPRHPTSPPRTPAHTLTHLHTPSTSSSDSSAALRADSPLLGFDPVGPAAEGDASTRDPLRFPGGGYARDLPEELEEEEVESEEETEETERIVHEGVQEVGELDSSRDKPLPITPSGTPTPPPSSTNSAHGHSSSLASTFVPRPALLTTSKSLPSVMNSSLPGPTNLSAGMMNSAYPPHQPTHSASSSLSARNSHYNHARTPSSASSRSQSLSRRPSLARQPSLPLLGETSVLAPIPSPKVPSAPITPSLPSSSPFTAFPSSSSSFLAPTASEFPLPPPPPPFSRSRSASAASLSSLYHLPTGFELPPPPSSPLPASSSPTRRQSRLTSISSSLSLSSVLTSAAAAATGNLVNGAGMQTPPSNSSVLSFSGARNAVYIDSEEVRERLDELLLAASPMVDGKTTTTTFGVVNPSGAHPRREFDDHEFDDAGEELLEQEVEYPHYHHQQQQQGKGGAYYHQYHPSTSHQQQRPPPNTPMTAYYTTPYASSSQVYLGLPVEGPAPPRPAPAPLLNIDNSLLIVDDTDAGIPSSPPSPHAVGGSSPYSAHNTTTGLAAPPPPAVSRWSLGSSVDLPTHPASAPLLGSFSLVGGGDKDKRQSKDSKGSAASDPLHHPLVTKDGKDGEKADGKEKGGDIKERRKSFSSPKGKRRRLVSFISRLSTVGGGGGAGGGVVKEVQGTWEEVPPTPALPSSVVGVGVVGGVAAAAAEESVPATPTSTSSNSPPLPPAKYEEDPDRTMAPPPHPTPIPRSTLTTPDHQQQQDEDQDQENGDDEMDEDEEEWVLRTHADLLNMRAAVLDEDEDVVVYPITRKVTQEREQQQPPIVQESQRERLSVITALPTPPSSLSSSSTGAPASAPLLSTSGFQRYPGDDEYLDTDAEDRVDTRDENAHRRNGSVSSPSSPVHFRDTSASPVQFRGQGQGQPRFSVTPTPPSSLLQNGNQRLKSVGSVGNLALAAQRSREQQQQKEGGSKDGTVSKKGGLRSLVERMGLVSSSSSSSQAQAYEAGHRSSLSSSSLLGSPSPFPSSHATHNLAPLSSQTLKSKVLASSSSSLSSKYKRKLVVSGVDTEEGYDAVRAWCEAFGEVRRISRKEGGRMVVDFRKASVAETVCRLQAQVNIKGAGSVSLSWYTKKGTL